MIQNFSVDLGTSFNNIVNILTDREEGLGALFSFIKRPVKGSDGKITITNVAQFDDDASISQPLVLKSFSMAIDEDTLVMQLGQLQDSNGLLLTSYGIASVAGVDSWFAVFRRNVAGHAAPDLNVGAPAGTFTNIAATEFGGGSEAGMSSAYGGVVNPDKLEVSLPARVPPNQRNVIVERNGTSVQCRVNDVGPWNTTDRYWTTNSRPLAESQRADGTTAQNGRVPTNSAGIDLTPAVMVALGIAGPVNTRATVVNWRFA